MSLEISPSTPSTSHRPLPPSRSKRRSLVASASSSRHASPAAQSPGAPTPPVSRGAGVMGGLRERTEEELKRASREAIEEALREEWEVRDRLLEKVDQMERVHAATEAVQKELETNLKVLQSRTDEAMADQARLETDLMERDEVLERLRERLSQAESQTRDLQKRSLEQEATFEAERQSLQAQESHLQQRVRSLLAAKTSSPSKSSSPRHDEALSDLQEEMASMNISQSTLLARLNTVTKEVNDLRQANAALQEENEGWEFLVRERTFSSKTRDASADHAAPNHDPPSKPRVRGQLEALDEEMEMDELASDLEAQSPILDEGQMYIRDLDRDESRVTSKSANGHLAPPDTRRKPKGESLGDLPLTSSGLDLAAELGRAEVDLNCSEVRVLGKGDEGEALRAEIKNLRDTNKALTLYCSKIIDRVITQEGFEQVLSVDYKTRRLGRSASGQARGNLQDITANMQAQNIAPDQPAMVERKKSVTKRARPLSIFGRAASVEEPAEVKAPVVEEAKAEAMADKGGRKRFSLDLRSLGFGLPSLSSPAEPKPNPALRPLTLATKTSAATSSTPVPAARRSFAAEEEDEEDRRERHRMEAHLRLMGIEKPSTPEEPYAPSATYWTGRKLTKASGARTSSHTSSQSRQSSGMARSNSQDTNFRDGTPLSRLSSHLCSPDDPVSPIEQGEKSPRSIAPALNAFDEREAKRAKALAEGKAVTGFTSPSPGSIRRTSSRKRTSQEKRMNQSGSVDTLWSIGSSRPNSGEVVLNDDRK